MLHGKLCVVLKHACRVLQGVVAFCPSFAHCEQLYTRWQQTGMLAQLSTKKEVFREPRAASEIDSMLRRYAECMSLASGSQRNTQVAASTGRSAAGDTAGSGDAEIGRSAAGGSQTGGLMLCVVGGKLSEGINFSDGFGRYNHDCVMLSRMSCTVWLHGLTCTTCMP